MRIIFTCCFIFSILISGCIKSPDHTSLLKSLESKVESGDLTCSIELADSLKRVFSDDRMAFLKADSLRETAYRIKIDFASSSEQTIAAIEKKIGPVTPEQIAVWEKNGWLDFRIIDGRKMYFNRAASNLALLKNFNEQKYGNTGVKEDEESKARKIHTAEVLRSSGSKGNLTGIKKIGIVYTITVEAGAVPGNETVRCWLPWPRNGHPRQTGIRLLSVSQPDYIISPDSSVHSTIYMEQKAKKDSPTIFSLTCEY
ncbi:MAG: hypothetical protein ACM3UT_01210, partial [Chloroflexota bacterium]